MVQILEAASFVVECNELMKGEQVTVVRPPTVWYKVKPGIFSLVQFGKRNEQF